GRVVVIDARPRPLQSDLRHIRPIDLQAALLARRPARLQEPDDDRIDLFARGAPGDPDTHRRVFRPVLHDPRKDLLLQELEGVLVPEESGHANEEILVEALELARVLPQET